MMRREIDELDFPPLDEFIEMVIDSGAKVYGFKMSMDMMKLTAEDLVDGVEVLGAMGMLELPMVHMCYSSNYLQHLRGSWRLFRRFPE